ncbi:MAG: hypothetical protein EOO40_07045 [Deltaproteobacteria bacterium]|nr:MAG: hypothetical protein EOO40_07045 [Deltaproteobacteria bacterium]
MHSASRRVYTRHCDPMRFGPKALAQRLVRRAHNLAALGGLTPARLAPYGASLLSPQDLLDLQTVFAWTKDYIGKGHPELGRNGPICPFIPRALRDNRLLVTLRPEVRGPDAQQVEQLLLEHVAAFVRLYPARQAKDAYNSLLLVFNKLPDSGGAVVDEVHTRQKSSLMRRGIMLSNFHPLCDKPGIKNAAFTLYKAPFPCIVMRHMSLHDIIFLSHNRPGFAAYHRRFAAQYSRGEVKDDHGYVALYQAAVQRFG